MNGLFEVDLREQFLSDSLQFPPKPRECRGILWPSF
jgi:hypothetical protein